MTSNSVMDKSWTGREIERERERDTAMGTIPVELPPPGHPTQVGPLGQ